MPEPSITPAQFLGRDPQLRTLTANIDHHHATLVIGAEGIGKSALLDVVASLLTPERTIVTVERLTPFGTLLRDLYSSLWERNLIPEQTPDIAADLRVWGKRHPNNDAKARSLLALLDAHSDTVVMIDDAGGVTPTSRPHLEQLVETVTVVAAVHPAALSKRGTKRFWKRSEVGRVAGRVAGWLERRFGHRTLTHSLLGLAGVGVLTSPLLLIQRDLWLALMGGYGSHLLLDTANVAGVPLLWPQRLRFWLVGNRAWRVPYGGPRERAWFASIAVAALALAPLSLDGFGPWFHRALGTGYGAVEDYLLWKDTHEVWAHVRGANLVTGERIDGRYRVVDALHTEMLLVEDELGHPYTVGLGQAATITIGRVQVWPGEERRIVTQRVEVSGTIGELLARLPAEAERVHVTGILRTPDSVDPEPVVGRYSRIRHLGDTLELQSATPRELTPLAWVWIDEGSVLVRASYEMDVAVEPPLASEPAGQRLVLTLADLPDLTAIRVEVGQRVQVGDLIAHYPESAAVAAARQALEEAHTHRAELAEALERIVSDMSTDRQRLLSELDATRRTLDRATFLVARDALPLSAEREAMEDIVAAERALADHDLAAARRLRAIELDSEAAAARILALEERLDMELSTLEIRAAMAGTISAIRITGSDQHGVDATVFIIATSERTR